MAYDPLDPNADCFRPPAIPTLVGCLHCGEEYDSYKIEWRVHTNADGKQQGFWCCPTPGCDGCGFGFDIFPVDPDYRDENGDKMWISDDDEDMEDIDDDEFDDAEVPLDDEVDLESPPPEESHGNGKANGRRRHDDEDEIPF